MESGLRVAIAGMVVDAPSGVCSTLRTVFAAACNTVFSTLAAISGNKSGLRRAALPSLLSLLLSLLFFLLPSFAAHAQSVRFPFPLAQQYFERVGAASVIPENSVTALLLDKQGFLWIGTQNGLIQYDGYQFRRFTRGQNGLEGGPIGNFISALWQNADGKLWVGTGSDGLSIYDPATERFSHLQHEPGRAGLPGNQITALTGDHAGQMWIGTQQGLSLFVPGSEEVRTWRTADGLFDVRVRSLTLDKLGRLWVGSAGGLQRFNGKHWENPLPETETHIRSHGVQAVFEALDGKLWIASRHHLYWLENGELPLQAAPKRPATRGNIKLISQAYADQIWLGWSGAGIESRNARDGSLLGTWQHDEAVQGSLADNDVTSMVKDSAGLIWVGTLGGGLQRIDSNNQAIRILQHHPRQNESLSASNVFSMLELRDGRILFGVADLGIDIYQRERGKIGSYRPGSESGLSDGRINALLELADGTVLAGTHNHGVARLLPGAKRWQSLSLEYGLPDVQVKTMLLSKEGRLLVATRTGLAWWDETTQRFHPVRMADGSLLQQALHSLAEDSQGRIFAASHIGLWVLEVASGRLQLLQHDPRRADSLISNRVNGLLYDRQGRLWVDTALGLERLQRLEGGHAEFVHVSQQIGRPGRSLGENLQQDAQGRIWSEGLVLDVERMRYYELSWADGMHLEGSWFGSFCKTRDGLLLFGGAKGVAVLDPAKFMRWNFQPPVRITGLKLGGIARALADLQPVLQVQPQQRSFGVEFAALDYSLPQEIRYAYRLQGYDQQWINTDARQRSASYTNLWPGEYLLQVRATNRVGEWSNAVLEVPVRILPAFWQTAWFMGLLLCAISSLFYFAWRWKLARAQKEARRLRKLVEMRTADIVQLEKIGQELTANLDLEQAFAHVYKQVRSRLDAHVFRIGILDQEQAQLRFLYDMENGQRLPAFSNGLHEVDRPAIWCVLHQRELWAGSNQDLLRYIDTLLPPQIGAQMESVIYLPLMQEQEVIGCLSVQSPRTQAYTDTQLEFLRVLASYLAIAVANAQAHGKLGDALSHLQETQSRLIQSEKMAALGGLLAGIAHEINTPLGTVLMSLSGIQKNWLSLQQGVQEGRLSKSGLQAHTAEGLEYTELAQQGAGRAAQLVRIFQSVAVKSDGDESGTLDLQQYLQEVLALVRGRLQELGCTVEVEVAPGLQVKLVVQALTAALQPILENCVLHAFPPAPENIPRRSLLLRASLHQQNLLLEVTDNGRGIAAEHLSKVFDPFFSTSGRLGLGLYVAYNQITQRMAGDLWVESTGQGTRVCICVPV